jgi:hypothetical protein
MTTITHVTIDTAGQWLAPPAAAALQRAVAAGCPLAITSAGRTPDEQQHLIDLHAAYPAVYAYAAPVNASEHVTGNAIDTGDRNGHGPMGDWFATHPGYGFVRTALPAEPWHWAYRLGLDQHLTPTAPPAAPAPAPAQPTDQEDPMLVIRNATSGASFLLYNGRGTPILTATDLGAFQTAGVLTASLSPATYDLLAGAYVH